MKISGTPNYRHGSAFNFGPNCPDCGNGKSLVLDSRPPRGGIRRRRVCENGHRYTTREYAESEMAAFDPGI